MRSRLSKAWLAGMIVVTGAMSGLLSGCTTNPTTGRTAYYALSREEEIQIGEQSKGEMIREFGGEVKRAELRQYVRDVGMRLVATVGEDDPSMSSLPWEFVLLDSDVINAFALPGGKVFMSRGLAQRMTSEAQLAGVLGHEIGHVTAQHTSERFGDAKKAGAAASVGVIIGAVFGVDVSGLAEQAAGITLASYGRDQENEADALGIRYMVRAGYDPIGQLQVMQILASIDKTGRPPEFLSTHPYPEKRIENIQGKLRNEYAYTQGNPQFRTGEQEFRANFLSKLAEAFPAGREEDPAIRAFALSRGLCGADCPHCVNN
jgi:predicted Zn-dependent protease